MPDAVPEMGVDENALLPELEAQTVQLLQAQRELQRQAQLTDAILNALPINVFVKDEQGRLRVAAATTVGDSSSRDSTIMLRVEVTKGSARSRSSTRSRWAMSAARR